LLQERFILSWAEDDKSIFTKYVIEGLKGVKPLIDKKGREASYKSKLIKGSKGDIRVYYMLI
jgi:hypothetical protein